MEPEALGEVIRRRRATERLLEAAALQGDPEFVEQRFALAHGGEVTGEEPLEQIEIARKLGYRLVDHRLELYGMPLDD